MAKLTLSVDDDVIRRAKTYAAERGTSVSALVERLLDTTTKLPVGEGATPVLDALRGLLVSSGDSQDDLVEAHKEHLLAKHQ